MQASDEGATEFGEHLIGDVEEDSDEKEFEDARSKLYPGKFESYAIAAVCIIALLCVAPPVLGYFFHVAGTNGWAIMMGFMALLAFPPAFGIFWLVYWRHDRDKATYRGIGKFFLVGFLLVIPVLVIETIESLPWYGLLKQATIAEKEGKSMDVGDIGIGQGIAFTFYFSFVVAALTEESAKFVCCFLLKGHRPTITNPYTIVILITSSALGFAILENYGYILAAATTGDILWTLLSVGTRAVLSVPLHSITGILIGCSMANQHFEGDITFKFYLSTIWLPILLHGFFDLFAIVAGLGGYWTSIYAGNVAIVVVGIILSYKRIVAVKGMSEFKVKEFISVV